MDDGQLKRLGPSLDVILSRCVAYDPAQGQPGYEWLNDRTVVMHPTALAVLESRLESNDTIASNPPGLMSAAF